MPGLIDQHATAMGEFDRRVRTITPDDWALPTPCAEWTVRDLANHLTTEQLWVPHLLSGATIEDVGERFEGDNLGGDPVATWEIAAQAARTAWLDPSSLERTVHLSFGDAPGRVYLRQMTFDLAVHAWDLARALGVDETLDSALVADLNDWLDGRALGPGTAFGAPVPVSTDADAEQRLIALTGRHP